MSETVTVTAGGDSDSNGTEDLGQRDSLPDDVEVFRISGPFLCGVAGELLDALKRLGRTPRAIILRLELVPYLDASGAVALEEFLAQAAAAGTRVILAGAQPQPRAVLERLHLDRSNTRVAHADSYPARSEERRGGKEWVSTFNTRWSPYH